MTDLIVVAPTDTDHSYDGEAFPDGVEPEQLGSMLKAAREKAGMTQQQAAEQIGVSQITLSRWERGAQPVKRRDLMALARLYRTPFRALNRVSERLVETVSRETPGDAWSPNPSLRGKIPELAYKAAMLHCERLAAAGVPTEEVEEAERVMVDSRYAKANKREGRPMSEAEYVQLVDAIWDGISSILRIEGYGV